LNHPDQQAHIGSAFIGVFGIGGIAGRIQKRVVGIRLAAIR
jgi:hypothetical protein